MTKLNKETDTVQLINFLLEDIRITTEIISEHLEILTAEQKEKECPNFPPKPLS